MLYIVNKNAQLKTGEHTIHKETCKRKPKNSNVKDLGNFEDTRVARSEASKYYSCINGCAYCCKDIHLKR